MRREGSALQGAGTVMMKELADNLMSWRMLLLAALIFVTGAGAVWATIGEVKDLVGEDRFVFLRVFTTAKEPLPSFVAFLGFLIPIVAISLGFDNVNGEFGRRTMSRILAQPIYRDALLFGKFLAGLATLAVMLTALWLFVIGLGIVMLGLPPSTEEMVRGFAFLLATIAYSGVWLALALLFSVVFRSAATAALASPPRVAPPQSSSIQVSCSDARAKMRSIRSSSSSARYGLGWRRRTARCRSASR